MAETIRTCGGCTLCCRLMPVAEIGLLAGQRCQHQRHGKGCAIYDHAPLSCAAWTCAWLSDPDAAGLGRPDRSHYVVDTMPDYVTLQRPGEADRRMPVIQIWCDPAYPDAHRDPALRAYLSSHPVAALIRYNSVDAIIIVPPEITGFDHWYEDASMLSGPQHTSAQVREVVGHD